MKNKKIIILFVSMLLMLFINFLFIGSDENIDNSQFATSTTTWNFFKTQDGVQKFNFFGILCPIKTSHTRLGTTQSEIIFNAKVLCPKTPVDQIRKQRISEIEKKFQDSIKKLVQNEPGLRIALHATASPDYVKYGLEKSLTPGHLEKENQFIANARLIRAKEIFVVSGLQLIDSSAVELQLRDTAQVQYILKNTDLLTQMRYVNIVVSKEVTLISSTWISLPYLLPIWLLLFYYLFLIIKKYSSKKEIIITESQEQHTERPYEGNLSNILNFSSPTMVPGNSLLNERSQVLLSPTSTTMVYAYMYYVMMLFLYIVITYFKNTT